MAEGIIPLITIVTPSYNRASQLSKLYDSLMRQSKKNFVWMIVDDGSTDGTAPLVKQFQDERAIPIEYYKKENGGKHTALNFAIEQAQTELFFIVDSDDYLIDIATQIIEEDWSQCREMRLCGISYLRGYSPMQYIGDQFPKDHAIDSFSKVRVNKHITGDKAEVWATEYLKPFRFPIFPGERFLVESYLWLQVSKMADMLFVNKIIYITEYLMGGLTLSGRSLRISCPQGGMAFSLMAMGSEYPIVDRLKNGILYVAYSKFANKAFASVFRNEHQWLTLFTYPMGYLLFVYWKKKYKV